MKKVGVIGLGDMGSGLAKNLMANGFAVSGLDLDPARMQAFVAAGGTPADSAAEAGQGADAVFVMVMNGDQAKAVILGDGLVSTMAKGSAVILSATIKTREAEEIGAAMADTGIHLIDSPVSGGFPGAQGGTLTMMAAASDQVMAEFRDVMEAVSGTIHHVGTAPGMGQTVKACLQSLIGSIFTATYEASVLAARAGVSGTVLHKVFSTSSAGNGITNGSLENIMDRKFEKTGSHINTMHKDLTISMDLARDLGVPLFTAATAMQLFQAGKTRHPDGDNQSVTLVAEEIVGARLTRHGDPS